jgi:hypothetical protein
VVRLLHELVQWQAALSEPRYEATQSCEAALDMLYTFQVLDRPMSMMAEIFSGLASMPRSDMTKLRSMPLGIPKRILGV